MAQAARCATFGPVRSGETASRLGSVPMRNCGSVPWARLRSRVAGGACKPTGFVPIDVDARLFGVRRYFKLSTPVYVNPRVNVSAPRHFLASNVPVAGHTRISTWVRNETKKCFATAAARQGLSESALLKRLIEQMLAGANIHDVTESVALPDARDAPSDCPAATRGPRAAARARERAEHAGRDLCVGARPLASAAARAAAGSGTLEPPGGREGAHGDRSKPQHDGSPTATRTRAKRRPGRRRCSLCCASARRCATISVRS